MNAHWVEAQQDALEEGGGIHTADLVAPMLCGEVEDEDDDDEEEVSAAPSADLLTLAVGGQASRLLAWACTAHKKWVKQYYTHAHKSDFTSLFFHVIFCKSINLHFLNLVLLLMVLCMSYPLKNLLGWLSPPIGPGGRWERSWCWFIPGEHLSRKGEHTQ